MTLAAEGSTIKATWSAVEHATGYTLVYVVNGVESDPVALEGGNRTTYTIKDCTPGVEYTVKVSTVGDLANGYADSDSEQAATKTITTDIEVTGLTLSTYKPEVGQTITTTLAPTDATVGYQWYRVTGEGETETEDAITGATGSFYAVTAADLGYRIRCTVIGSGDYFQTQSATTTEPVAPIVLSAPTDLTLAAEGSTIKATWSAVEHATGYTAQYKLSTDDGNVETNWKNLDVDVDALTGTFTGVAGKTYDVRVQALGDLADGYSDSDYCSEKSILIRTPITGLKLTDNPTVGTTITPTLAPTGATASYTWTCNGETSEGETFVVTTEHIGQTITCVAIGTGDYIGTVSSTTTVIPAMPLNDLTSLDLEAVGTTVTVSWTDNNNEGNTSSYTVEYQADGDNSWTSVIVGADEDLSYTFTGAPDTTYNVQVKANGEGIYSDSDFSEKSILIGTVLTGLTLSTYKPEVGQTITTTLAPTGATADYQWYRIVDGQEQKIDNETNSFYKLTTDDIGSTITCVATGTGDYFGTVSATTEVIPLERPTGLALSAVEATITATWDSVDNASSYTLEYRADGTNDWTPISGIQATEATFTGSFETTYEVRVKAVGTGNYVDSEYCATKTISLGENTKPFIAINGKKVTVLWSDESLAADSVRYREVGATKWTVKKVKEGETEFTFNGKLGTTYEVQVLLDQNEGNILSDTATVLDQAKLKADKTFLKDDTFQVSVTNYAAKNLSTNAKQAVVIVNGEQVTIDIENQEGTSKFTDNPMDERMVSFSNGVFTFTGMDINTQYKVQVSFSDGVSYSTLSSTLSVKTTKACYNAPENVTATATSDTTIEVTWETAYGKNSTTAAQKYTVQYSTDGVKWSNATTGATGNAYTIQKLKGGVEYQVRVLASKDKAFEASLPSSAQLPNPVTLATPKTALDKASLTSNSFKVNVTNYNDTNLTGTTKVEVAYNAVDTISIDLENGSGSKMSGDMTVTFENGILTFTGVPSYTSQKIQVRFTDGVCTTAWSNALSFKTAKEA